MIRLSLCMIVKNEEAVLTRVLASAIQFADEILVADTGSTDRTVEISRQYTKHIYHYPWNDDFAAARNFICEKVSTEYWMWLDADDIVPAESIATTYGISFDVSSSPYLDVSVQAVPFQYLWIQYWIMEYELHWVAPFRYLRINGCLLLPEAFRSLPRLSSAPSAKAFTLRPF